MTAFSFFFPIFGLVIINLLFKNVKEARQGWLFYFWEKRRVAWLSSKPNTNVSLPVLQRIGKSIHCHHPEVWSINAIISANWIILWVLPISNSNTICVLFLPYSMNLVDEGIGHLPPPCEWIDLLMPNFPLQWLDIQLPMQ